MLYRGDMDSEPASHDTLMQRLTASRLVAAETGGPPKPLLLGMAGNPPVGHLAPGVWVTIELAPGGDVVVRWGTAMSVEHRRFDAERDDEAVAFYFQLAEPPGG
jgi:hypothetical protein